MSRGRRSSSGAGLGGRPFRPGYGGQQDLYSAAPPKAATHAAAQNVTVPRKPTPAEVFQINALRDIQAAIATDTPFYISHVAVNAGDDDGDGKSFENDGIERYSDRYRPAKRKAGVSMLDLKEDVSLFPEELHSLLVSSASKQRRPSRTRRQLDVAKFLDSKIEEDMAYASAAAAASATKTADGAEDKAGVLSDALDDNRIGGADNLDDIDESNDEEDDFGDDENNDYGENYFDNGDDDDLDDGGGDESYF